MTTQSGSGHGRPDPGLDAIISEGRRLINLAYRLLGSLAEAEDAVQETYARWYAMTAQQQDAIESPGAYLITVASRICLNLLGSARARREIYVGAWLPEPLPDPAEWPSGRPGAAVDPADRITLDESVSMAFLVVLESMTPAERVAFILHDVFGYPFADIAGITGRTPAACRQLASTARRRARAAQPPATPTARQAAVIKEFKQAWEAKDINALIGLLDPGATLTGDGGAALRPIEGAQQVARFLTALARAAPGDVSLLERTVNGQPGLVKQQDGVTVAVYAFEMAGDQITRIWAILNPGKLRPWTHRPGVGKVVGRDAGPGGALVTSGQSAGTALVADHGGYHTFQVTAGEPCPPPHHPGGARHRPSSRSCQRRCGLAGPAGGAGQGG